MRAEQIHAVVGIDLGTQSTKAVVVDVDGAQLAEASEPVAPDRPRAGWVEHDASLLEQTAITAVDRALRSLPRPATVVAIGVTGQMGGAVGIDADFTAVTPYESWMDTRADEERHAMLNESEQTILATAGITPLAGARVRRWLRVHPDRAARLRAVVAPVGYLVGRLTGASSAREATCDRTQAALFGCYEADQGAWSPTLAHTLGIPPALLPELVDPTDVAGHLTRRAAEAMGLPARIPVVGGLGDGTGGWLAAGGIIPGRCVETGGTSGNMAITVDRYCPDPHGVLACMRAPDPALWYLLGFTTGTGLTHRWATELLAAGDYATLEQEAALVPPGSEGVLCVPHPHGRVSPSQPDVRSAFLGFDETTGRAQLYRAVIESLAYEVHGWLAAARRLVPNLSPARIACIGGGASSRLWAQIKADVTGIEVARLQPVVGAARGAALVAAMAVGAATLDATSWHAPERTVAQVHTPDPQTHQRYAPFAAAYPRLVDTLRPAYAELAHLVPTEHEPKENTI